MRRRIPALGIICAKHFEVRFVARVNKLLWWDSITTADSSHLLREVVRLRRVRRVFRNVRYSEETACNRFRAIPRFALVFCLGTRFPS